MNDLLEPEAGARVAAPPARLLVADDEESMRFYLSCALRRHGYDVEVADSGDSALARLAERPFDVYLVDLRMPGMDGMQVLTRVRGVDSTARVILMTGYGSIPSAVEAMKKGAFDYITKPFEMEELLFLVGRALAAQAGDASLAGGQRKIDVAAPYAGLVGQNPAMRTLYETIDLVSESSATVLIVGESGTGKELVANAIHQRSPRAKHPFVSVNCAALPDTLLENELFGHQAGAFTGATERKRGLIERATGGTLFLDKVSEMSLQGQVKLLRFLQEREITPLGASEPKVVDVRVIATSDRDLEDAVEAGAFREDLFWRLNVVPIRVPALRERRDDIPALVAEFLDQFKRKRGGAARSLTMAAMRALADYPWPGNVRELQNLIERLVVLHADRETLDVNDLPHQIRGGLEEEEESSAPTVTYRSALQSFERDYVRGLLEQCNGNITQAAQLAGISRQSLHAKVAQLGLDPDVYRR